MLELPKCKKEDKSKHILWFGHVAPNVRMMNSMCARHIHVCTVAGSVNARLRLLGYTAIVTIQRTVLTVWGDRLFIRRLSM